jgi:hypothetical protein
MLYAVCWPVCSLLYPILTAMSCLLAHMLCAVFRSVSTELYPGLYLTRYIQRGSSRDFSLLTEEKGY